MNRVAHFYEGDDHVDDEYINIIAKTCAECSRDFGCSHCMNCVYNPAQFVEFNRAKMIRTAYMVALENRLNDMPQPIGAKLLKFGAIIIGIFLALISITNNNNDITKYSYNSYKSNIKSYSKTSLKEVEKEVQKALYKVRDNIKDINYDGIINCQDYCILFVKYYPTAQIVYNKYIGKTGHVFIRVHTDDGWLYIEPQNTTNYYARNAWYKDIYSSIKKHNTVVPKEWFE